MHVQHGDMPLVRHAAHSAQHIAIKRTKYYKNSGPFLVRQPVCIHIFIKISMTVLCPKAASDCDIVYTYRKGTCPFYLFICKFSYFHQIVSSTILSREIDVNRYGVIYAGAQKNIGPAGLTLVIVREDLLGKASVACPSILDYTVLSENDSMFNTPPTFAWYLAGLVFKWLKQQGGVATMDKINQQKAELLYGVIDNSGFYRNDVAQANRSRMNVPFQLADSALDKLFLEESFAAGLHALKGHRVVGGMRASIYNAMPLDGVKALTDFMLDFERRHG